MIVGVALHQIAEKLERFNNAQRRNGLPPLEHADMTWLERQMELDTRVNAVCRSVVAHGRPDMELLDALGAHVLACKLAVVQAEEFDPTSGADAA